MLGDETKNDKNFTPEEYDNFYEHHYFLPISEGRATEVHEFIPRFGWAFEKVKESKAKNLLDLGCLDGSFALTVARHLGISVSGVDLSVDGIKLAQQRAEGLGINAHFFQGSIEEELSKLKANSFDIITLFEVIEHLEDVQKVLKLIDRVLKPGGTVLLSTPDFEDPTYGLDDEQNTCHVRLYTTADKGYSRENKYGTLRKATSLSKEIGKDRIKEMQVIGEQICAQYA